MPLPPFLISASIFTCERVLQEKDEVISAIRLVEVYFVASQPPPEVADLDINEPPPPNLPVIVTYAIARVLAVPGYTGFHKLQVKIINTRDELIDLGQQAELPFGSSVPIAPPSMGFIAQIKLAVRNLGVCYLCLYLDGEEVARHALTIALAPQPQGT